MILNKFLIVSIISFYIMLSTLHAAQQCDELFGPNMQLGFEQSCKNFEIEYRNFSQYMRSENRRVTLNSRQLCMLRLGNNKRENIVDLNKSEESLRPMDNPEEALRLIKFILQGIHNQSENRDDMFENVLNIIQFAL